MKTHMGRLMGSLAALCVMASAAYAQQHSQCWLQQQGMLNQGANPTDAEIFNEAKALAVAYNIPYEVIVAIAYQESGIRQFASDGYLLHNQAECSGLYNGASSPNPPGLGMMQLTGSTATSYDLAQLRTDWTYNLESGIKVLNGKFSTYKSNAGSTLSPLIEANRGLIENWYMGCWYYNGYVGNYGSYADKIFAHIANRPGKLVNILPAGLAPTTPDVPITHFFNSSKGEAYVAQADSSWICAHGTTATAPVTPTGNSPGGGGTPPPPAASSDSGGSSQVDRCGGSAGASGSMMWIAPLLALMALRRSTKQLT